MVAYVVEHHQISISRACRVASLPNSMYYFKSTKDDSETITKLQQLAEIYPTKGQDLYYGRIRTQVYQWNYKRVRRVYLLLGLNHRRIVRKR
jgi:putative transposase